jgi:hypothetical protein
MAQQKPWHGLEYPDTSVKFEPLIFEVVKRKNVEETPTTIVNNDPESIDEDV